MTTIPTLTERLEAATVKAEGASGIMHDVANGGPLIEVPTESGPVPSIAKWFADLNDRTSGAVGQVAADLEAEVQAREQAVSAEAQARAQADQALQQAVGEKQPAMPTATGAEMRAGTEEALRAVSPALVRESVESQRQALRARNFIDATYVNAAAAGAVTLDLSQADVFDLTLAGATTLSISNAPALSGETFAFVVSVTQPATAYSLAWFAGVTWRTPNGAVPAAPAAGKSAEYVFSTTDGTNFIGRTGAAS